MHPDDPLIYANLRASHQTDPARAFRDRPFYYADERRGAPRPTGARLSVPVARMRAAVADRLSLACCPATPVPCCA